MQKQAAADHAEVSVAFAQGHHERVPYTDGSMRSAYHIRELEVFRLAQLAAPLDVFVSHDWPRGIARHGDLRGLLRAKSFLRNEVRCCCALHSLCTSPLLPAWQYFSPLLFSRPSFLMKASAALTIEA